MTMNSSSLINELWQVKYENIVQSILTFQRISYVCIYTSTNCIKWEQ